MIGDILGSIKNLLAALAAGLGLMQARDQRANSPEMQRAATAKTDQEIKDEANAAIAKQDIETLRKLNS